MTTNGTSTTTPSEVRRLDGPGPQALTELVADFEELQTALRCCERLIVELAAETGPDEVVVESLWTMTLMSYARCFAPSEAGVALTEEDVSATQSSSEALDWHRLLLQLREHHCDPVGNPREQFSVGAIRGPTGEATGVAITSARQPLVDDVTVRRTGAIAYTLSGLVNQRIESRQAEVFEEAKALSADELAELVPLDVAVPAGT